MIEIPSGSSSPMGWVCPRCNRVNAPWMPICSCNEVSVETRTLPWVSGFIRDDVDRVRGLVGSGDEETDAHGE